MKPVRVTTTVGWLPISTEIPLSQYVPNVYTIVAGADNVFDKYPQTDYDYPDFSFDVVYPRASTLGYHGGFWYLRRRAEF